jgi:hypothetical protein
MQLITHQTLPKVARGKAVGPGVPTQRGVLANEAANKLLMKKGNMTVDAAHPRPTTVQLGPDVTPAHVT